MDQKKYRWATKALEAIELGVCWVQFGKIDREDGSDGEAEAIRREMRRPVLVGLVTIFYISLSLVVGFVIFCGVLVLVLPASIMTNAEGDKLQVVAITCLLVWIFLPWFIHTHQFSTRKGKLERDGVLRVLQFDIFYLFGLVTALLLLGAFNGRDALTANVLGSLGPFVFAGPFLLIMFDAYAKVPAGMSRREHEQLCKQLSEKYDEELEPIAGQHTVEEWKKRRRVGRISMAGGIVLGLASASVIARWDVQNVFLVVIAVLTAAPCFFAIERLGSMKQILPIRQRLDEASQREVSN